MTATDELRRMLDERGVKWEARTSPRGRIWTYWDAFNGHRVYAMDNENGTVEIFGEWDVTPAQAVEATLGAGTCHMEQDFRRWDDDLGWLTSYTCSVCGESVILMSDRKPSCCPNCGARVMGVDE